MENNYVSTSETTERKPRKFEDIVKNLIYHTSVCRSDFRAYLFILIFYHEIFKQLMKDSPIFFFPYLDKINCKINCCYKVGWYFITFAMFSDKKN